MRQTLYIGVSCSGAVSPLGCVLCLHPSSAMTLRTHHRVLSPPEHVTVCFCVKGLCQGLRSLAVSRRTTFSLPPLSLPRPPLQLLSSLVMPLPVLTQISSPFGPLQFLLHSRCDFVFSLHVS